MSKRGWDGVYGYMFALRILCTINLLQVFLKCHSYSLYLQLFSIKTIMMVFFLEKKEENIATELEKSFSGKSFNR